MANFDYCKKLSEAFGPSGYEKSVANLVCELMTGYTCEKDNMQNVYANLDSAADKPVVMLDAHLDEVGFMVQSIKANGMIKLIPLGGWVEHNIPAHTVWVKSRSGKLLKGVTTSTPIHFGNVSNGPLSLNDIFVDLGVSSRQEVLDMGVEPGCPIAPCVDFEYNETTGLMLGKAFDCRLGCAATLEVMERLSKLELAVHPVATFSTQEEVGLRGAKVCAAKVKPSIAICLEGTPADDVTTAPDEAQGALKKGVQVRYRDGSMVANPGLVAFVKKLAKEKNITTQFAVRVAGGTNGGSYHLANEGIPTVILGMPVRYPHTHYGYTALADYEAAVELAVELMKALTPEIIATIGDFE